MFASYYFLKQVLIESSGSLYPKDKALVSDKISKVDVDSDMILVVFVFKFVNAMKKYYGYYSLIQRAHLHCPLQREDPIRGPTQL